MGATRRQPESAMKTQLLETSLNETRTTRTFRVRDTDTGEILYATRSYTHAENIERARQRLLAYATDEQVQLIDKDGKVKIEPLDPAASTPAERRRWGRLSVKTEAEAQPTSKASRRSWGRS